MANGLSFFIIVMVEGLRALVLVNGHPVVDKIDAESDRVAEKIVPYLRTGTNSVTVLLSPMPSAEQGEQAFSLLLTQTAPDQAPVDGTPLHTFTWNQATHSLATDGNQTRVLHHEFSIQEQLGPWAWEQAKPVIDTGSVEADLYKFVADVAARLRTGKSGAVLPLLSLRHREISQALGLTESRMQNGFQQGFANLAAADDFAVDLPPRDDLVFRWEPRNRWAVPLRRNGEAAIQMTSDGFQQPFEMVIARINSAWTIIR